LAVDCLAVGGKHTKSLSHTGASLGRVDFLGRGTCGGDGLGETVGDASIFLGERLEDI